MSRTSLTNLTCKTNIYICELLATRSWSHWGTLLVALHQLKPLFSCSIVYCTIIQRWRLAHCGTLMVFRKGKCYYWLFRLTHFGLTGLRYNSIDGLQVCARTTYSHSREQWSYKNRDRNCELTFHCTFSLCYYYHDHNCY